MKAPQGCLQYYTGDTGTITTYNYNGGTGVLLGNQDYSICVRYRVKKQKHNLS